MTRTTLKRLEEGKLYYSISEVCLMTGLEQHVLRYWENEFPQLHPKKNRSGNRAYRGKEIKLIRYIKYLLYDEMYTIQGAKRKLADSNPLDLEGQVNLLGSLPGMGAALPSASTLPNRKKQVVQGNEAKAESPYAPDPSGPPFPETAPTFPPADRVAMIQELRRDLTAILDLLRSPS